MEKGLSNTKVCHCGEKSISGLKKGIALCKYHFNVHMYGVRWSNWIAGKALCVICETPVTIHDSSYTNVAYCHKCYAQDSAVLHNSL